MYVIAFVLECIRVCLCIYLLHVLLLAAMVHAQLGNSGHVGAGRDDGRLGP